MGEGRILDNLPHPVLVETHPSYILMHAIRTHAASDGKAVTTATLQI
jgi:hypothetical protein